MGQEQENKGIQPELDSKPGSYGARKASAHLLRVRELTLQWVYLDLCLPLSRHRTDDTHIGLHGSEGGIGYGGRVWAHSTPQAATPPPCSSLPPPPPQ